ncbi:unnamed protein product, partial [Staurois parvus]
MIGHHSSHRHQRWGTIPPTDTNDGAPFLPQQTPFLPPMIGHHSSHRHQRWGTIPPADTKDGGTIPPTDTTKMGHHSSRRHQRWGTHFSFIANNGALFLLLKSMMALYTPTDARHFLYPL